MSKSKWGKLLSSYDLKSGDIMKIYRNGNMIYFVVNDKIEKSFHVEDGPEVLGALMGVDDESGI